MHWIDPACLPETRGKVSQFLLNPRGEVDGFILERSDRTRQQVHFPPHLSKRVARHVVIGDTVRVRGVKPRAADLVAAISLTTKNAIEIVDEGPPHPRDAQGHAPAMQTKPMDVQGEVVLPLFGPKGELRGALLDDGTSLRMPPHAAAELAVYLTPGVHVQAWGDGVKSRLGRTVNVHEIAELVDE
ncbi:hypothetical protein [Paraburkholderia kururiensis]|uniref:Uncharacterized protein n=1 Tax=Paraburkholderia kururiensis TaxID=984307 RepID=A0ABZ0WNU4_9BURK|nr:hypothetical protein [Paraburkholderia kururiensis]WQD79059.1 hypothetical protein U0042_04975 [Paraburkholderia kururiensis]